eukprot:6514273-Pyramimonas_sp.AAC.1
MKRFLDSYTPLGADDVPGRVLNQRLRRRIRLLGRWCEELPLGQTCASTLNVPLRLSRLCVGSLWHVLTPT